ncbi:MAG: hypothetical protein K6F28_10535 [Lachnospiraceae bacterium]|nr:hypothetical protein [Lachnospiraceae bacterium]
MDKAKAEYTISASNDNHAETHSRRAYTPFSAEASLADKNIVIYDCGDDRTHFNDFFRPARIKYNEKQTRNDRKKDLNYLEALEDGREGYGKGDKKEKPFYHDVIQIGDRNTNGITDDSFDVDHWRELKRANKFDEAAKYVKEHLPKERTNHYKYQQQMIEVLKEIAEEIRCNKDNKYSNILVHGLIIHCDEPNGTPHLDFRYSIFTADEKTGVSTRISMNKGLKKMGYVFSKDNIPINQFREDIKDRIEIKMMERGFGRTIKNEHRKHLRPEVYELEQRAIKAEERAKAAEQKEEAIIRREQEVEEILTTAQKLKSLLETMFEKASNLIKVLNNIKDREQKRLVDNARQEKEKLQQTLFIAQGLMDALDQKQITNKRSEQAKESFGIEYSNTKMKQKTL